MSSTEVSQVKGNSFSYNVDISRLVQARGSSVPSSLSVPVSAFHDGINVSETQTLPSRGGSASTYGGKQYYAPAEWNSGYAEDSSVDYPLCQPFQSVAEHHPYVAAPYRLAPNASVTKPNGVVFLDAEAAYGYATVPTTQTLPSSGPLSYRTNRPASEYRNSSQHSTGNSSSSSSLVDVPGNYPTYESSQLSYSGHSVAMQLNRHDDLYASSSTDGILSGSETSLRPLSGCETYRYPDASFNRVSQPALETLTANSSQSYAFDRHVNQHETYTVAADIVAASPVDAGTGDLKPQGKTRV